MPQCYDYPAIHINPVIAPNYSTTHNSIETAALTSQSNLNYHVLYIKQRTAAIHPAVCCTAPFHALRVFGEPSAFSRIVLFGNISGVPVSSLFSQAASIKQLYNYHLLGRIHRPKNVLDFKSSPSTFRIFAFRVLFKRRFISRLNGGNTALKLNKAHFSVSI